MIDAGEHIGILHHVVDSATMNIPPHMKDEALSEGLVILVQAAKSYDSKYGVPPHYWLAKKLRWGLKNWKLRESHKASALGEDTLSWQAPAPTDGLQEYDPIALHEIRLELERFVNLAGEILGDKEYIAVIGPAFGLHMKELAHVLGANPNQIKAMQMRGRELILINEMRLL